MSRVEDKTTKMELESIVNRLDRLEQSLKNESSSASSKNSERQLNTYRLVKEDSKYYIEFKHKDGWVRSDASNFTLRG